MLRHNQRKRAHLFFAHLYWVRGRSPFSLSISDEENKMAGEHRAWVRLAFILSGMDQNAIARKIGVQASTVVTLRRRGNAKLGVHNGNELRESVLSGL